MRVNNSNAASPILNGQKVEQPSLTRKIAGVTAGIITGTLAGAATLGVSGLVGGLIASTKPSSGRVIAASVFTISIATGAYVGFGVADSIINPDQGG